MESIQKATAAMFSSSLPFVPFVFYLVIPKHIFWVHGMHVLDMLWGIKDM
jgi:hypothetical protein